MFNNLYIDFDGVLLDSQERMDNDLNHSKDQDLWYEYLNQLNWREFLSTCDEIDNSFTHLKELERLNRVRAILTKIHSLEEGIAKTEYVRSKGILLPVIYSLHYQPKSVVVPPTSELTLVDDKMSNCLEWASRGGTSIWFNEKYNGEDKHIIKSLKQLL